MRLLGIDLGERRIGLAVGDESGRLALPAGHLERITLRYDISRLLEIARQREVGGFVVGMPYTLSGEVGPQARQAQGFIRALRKETDLTVHTMDERFTSVEAEGMLREAGQQPSRRRADVDAMAATLILQRFLDQRGD
ncbi:MAG: Holliday junction resolvase RuvX [Dehalococcoidia bacterium]